MEEEKERERSRSNSKSKIQKKTYSDPIKPSLD